MVKECVICTKMFDEYRSRQKCCSPECSKIHNINYQKSPAFKEVTKRYRLTDNGKLKHRQYKQTEKCKEYDRQYEKTEKCINKRRIWAKSDKRKQYTKSLYNSDEYRKYIREYKKKWNQTLSGKINSLNQHMKRRVYENNCIHTFTAKEWQDKLNATNGICCGVNGRCLSDNSNVGINNLTTDHIYSIAKANEDFLKTGIKRIYTINDIQFLCRSCNASKGDKIIITENQKVYKPQNNEICIVNN